MGWHGRGEGLVAFGGEGQVHRRIQLSLAIGDAFPHEIRDWKGGRVV